MCPITKIKAEGEPADGSRRGGGNDGRSRTGFISGGFHRQTLAPTHPGVSGLPSHLIWLGHKNVITQKMWNARNKPTAQIKLPAPSKTKTPMRLLPRDSFKKPTPATAKPQVGKSGGLANTKASMPTTTTKNPERMLMVTCGLTTQAQPRRVSGGEPRSGTQAAPRRWLQRLVRPRHLCPCSFQYAS